MLPATDANSVADADAFTYANSDADSVPDTNSVADADAFTDADSDAAANAVQVRHNLLPQFVRLAANVI